MSPSIGRGLRAAVIVACTASTLRWLVHALRAATFPFPLDYGEGPLLDQGARLLAGESIYARLGSETPFTVANYPPVVPAILALLHGVGLHGWAPARGLVIASSMACVVFVVCLATGREHSWMGGAVAGALFLSFPPVFIWSCFVRVDFIALAFALASVLVAATRPAARSTPLICAVLACLAVLSRQSYLLAAPVAVIATLAAVDRRRAVTFVAALAALVAMAALAMHIATKGGFWFHIVVSNMNPWRGRRLVHLAAAALLAASGALVAALYAATRIDRRDPASVGATAYFIAAAVSSMLAGKDGASLNYFLELAAASSILVGRAYAVGQRRGDSLAALCDLCLLGQLAVCAVARPHVLVALDARLRERQAFEQVAARLAREPGPILADEMMGLLTEQGKRVLLQPFELAELARQHVWDDSAVVRDIRDQRFGLIAIAGDSLTDGPVRERWTRPMRDAIAQRYEREDTLGGIMLFRPRPALP